MPYASYNATIQMKELTLDMLSTSDRIAILDLAARYNHLMDWGDAQAWADCFTVDGIFDGGPKLQAEGHDALVAFMERMLARDIPARHWINSPVIEGSGNEARLTLYLLVVNLTAEGPYPRHLGVYHDDLVRTNKGWRFRRRRLGHL